MFQYKSQNVLIRKRKQLIKRLFLIQKRYPHLSTEHADEVTAGLMRFFRYLLHKVPTLAKLAEWKGDVRIHHIPVSYGTQNGKMVVLRHTPEYVVTESYNLRMKEWRNKPISSQLGYMVNKQMIHLIDNASTTEKLGSLFLSVGTVVFICDNSWHKMDQLMHGENANKLLSVYYTDAALLKVKLSYNGWPTTWTQDEYYTFISVDRAKREMWISLGILYYESLYDGLSKIYYNTESYDFDLARNFKHPAEFFQQLPDKQGATKAVLKPAMLKMKPETEIELVHALKSKEWPLTWGFDDHDLFENITPLKIQLYKQKGVDVYALKASNERIVPAIQALYTPSTWVSELASGYKLIHIHYQNFNGEKFIVEKDFSPQQPSPISQHVDQKSVNTDASVKKTETSPKKKNPFWANWLTLSGVQASTGYLSQDLAKLSETLSSLSDQSKRDLIEDLSHASMDSNDRDKIYAQLQNLKQNMLVEDFKRSKVLDEPKPGSGEKK